MKQTLAIKMLMPAAFLFVLGLGNIIVGYYKGLEYDRVLSELSPSPPSNALENVSPMQRMQIERVAATRLDERRSRAEARRDFYRLVTFGGKGFVVLGFLFFCCGLLAGQWQKRRSLVSESIAKTQES